MLKVENVEVYGFEAAIRGARNPMNSWDRMDSWQSDFTQDGKEGYVIGPNDYKLLKNLTLAGPEHRKWNRMVTVTMDITAPLYWFSEYDTYKIATTANSTSKMHKIQAKEFELDDFSYEHLLDNSLDALFDIIEILNYYREVFNTYQDDYVHNKKDYWWQMIQLLPNSYNQKRTVHLNYETLGAMYRQRRHHKLDEWHVFCDTLEKLPYSEFITMKFEEVE
jgi:hypothetical protein